MAQISVIIPTWNEIDYIPRLIGELSSSPHVTELIVADNASSDGTPELALAAGCSVVSGGLPAVGRNNGAAVAQESVLVFVDADAGISAAVIDALVEAFRDQDVLAVHFRHKPVTDRRLITFMYQVLDIYLVVCDRLGRSYGVGTLIAVRRDGFEAIGGFDEAVLVAEDFDFMRRLRQTKIGRIKYERTQCVEVSMRRFELENAVVYMLKSLVWGTLRAVGVKASVFNYKWQVYPRLQSIVPTDSFPRARRKEPAEDEAPVGRS